MTSQAPGRRRGTDHTGFGTSILRTAYHRAPSNTPPPHMPRSDMHDSRTRYASPPSAQPLRRSSSPFGAYDPPSPSDIIQDDFDFSLGDGEAPEPGGDEIAAFLSEHNGPSPRDRSLTLLGRKPDEIPDDFEGYLFDFEIEDEVWFDHQVHTPAVVNAPTRHSAASDQHNNRTTGLRQTPQPSRKRRRADTENASINSRPSKATKLGKKECAICAEARATNQFPKLPHIGALKHEHNTCRKCWDSHLRAEIETKKSFDRVSCPECQQRLQEPEVRKLARKSTYSDLLDQAAKCAMKADEEYRACPSASCTWACFMSKEDGHIFTCRLCSYRYCTHCEIPMHEDETCTQFRDRTRARDAAEGLSLAEVGKISKACPNLKCQARLDKWAGCDHVTCSQCRHEFCWECFAPYLGDNGIWAAGNSAHRAGCQYSPERLPDVPLDAVPEESDEEGLDESEDSDPEESD